MRKIIYGILVLALLVAVMPAEAANVNMQIINNTGYRGYYLYVKPSSSSSWGPDRLGNDTLASGSSINLTVENNRPYDVRLVDEDGDSYTYSMRRSYSGNFRVTIEFSYMD